MAKAAVHIPESPQITHLLLTKPLLFYNASHGDACVTRGSRWGLAFSLFTDFFID